MKRNPCPQCRSERESLEAECRECGWSPEAVQVEKPISNAKRARWKCGFYAGIGLAINVFLLVGLLTGFLNVRWNSVVVPAIAH